MPSIHGDRTPDPKQAPKLTPGPRKNLEKNPMSPDWRLIWWYIPFVLFMLWFWQDQLRQMTVETIPYSQFKQYLAKREVAECEVEESEITGRIVPKKAKAESAATATEEAEGGDERQSCGKRSEGGSPTGRPAEVQTDHSKGP
jgi:hypothetical protein